MRPRWGTLLVIAGCVAILALSVWAIRNGAADVGPAFR